MTWIALLLAGLWACCEPEIGPEPVDPEPPMLPVLWSQRINTDSSTSFLGPIHWKDDRLYFINTFYKPYSLVQCRDAINGSLHWTYDNPDLGELTGKKETVIEQGEFIVNAHGHFYQIALADGAESKVDKQSGKGLEWPAKLTYYGGYIYCSNDESGVDDQFSNLVRRSLEGGNWELLFTEAKGPDGFSDDFNAPSVYVLDGDTLLLTANRMWHFPNSKGRLDVMAYSIRDKKLKWQIDSIDPTGLGSSHSPTIYEGKAYFQGHHTLYCVDIASGEQLWEYEMPEYLHTLLQCQPIVAEGKLFLKSNNVTLYALNPQTGQLIWKNSNTEYETQKLQYANGMIIFTSHHYLMVINASNGKTIWKKRSPFEDSEANFNGWVPVGVNAQDSMIYASDKKNIMAIKMPQP